MNQRRIIIGGVCAAVVIGVITLIVINMSGSIKEIIESDNATVPPENTTVVTESPKLIETQKPSQKPVISESRLNTLLGAAESGNLTAVKSFVEQGANVNEGDSIKWTPLHYAAKNGQLEVVKYLLEKGAVVNASDVIQTTPLHTASARGHLEIVKYLLENDANVDAAQSNGCTPLHLAAENGHLSVVKLLMDKGADINIKDNSLRTPLAYASFKGHLDIARLLLGIEPKDSDEKWGMANVTLPVKH